LDLVISALQGMLLCRAVLRTEFMQKKELRLFS